MMALTANTSTSTECPFSQSRKLNSELLHCGQAHFNRRFAQKVWNMELPPVNSRIWRSKDHSVQKILNLKTFLIVRSMEKGIL